MNNTIFKGSMKKKMFLTVLAAFAGLLLCGTAQAVENSSFYRGIRPLGMGDAFTALANDENAAFYNPAGLASVSEGKIEIFNPLIEVGSNTMSFYNDAKNLNTGDTASAVDLMKANVGKHQHARFSIFPNYTRHNFEIGIIGQGTVDGEIHSPAYPVMTMDVKVDAGALAAIAGTFMEDRLQLGGTLKYVQRTRFYKDFTAAMVANSNTSYSFDQDKKTASAVGLDVGAIYKLKNETWNPTLGVAILNLGDMNFGDMTVTTLSSPLENKIKQSINLGAAASYSLAWASLTGAVDIKDIANNTSTDSDKGKKLHVGLEAKLPKILTLRAGWNQGYLSYGVGVDLWLLKLSYAYYKEEIGAYAGQREDARHVVQLSLGW
ncbi:MAG: conjugal transfer protein TraF [Nitrospinae bacterium]|nr:conjugal transfer protein TraF [Nitrospinota bacterium]